MKTRPDNILAAAPGVRVVRTAYARGIGLAAVRIGVDRRTLKRWLDGEVEPSAAHRAAAEALGIRLPARARKRRPRNPRKATP